MSVSKKSDMGNYIMRKAGFAVVRSDGTYTFQGSEE
jgi:hypothetical protein